jgi:hypothetical protein
MCLHFLGYSTEGTVFSYTRCHCHQSGLLPPIPYSTQGGGLHVFHTRYVCSQLLIFAELSPLPEMVCAYDSPLGRSLLVFPDPLAVFPSSEGFLLIHSASPLRRPVIYQSVMYLLLGAKLCSLPPTLEFIG